MQHRPYCLSTPHRRLSQLLQQISDTHTRHERKSIRDILQQKRNKMREIYSMSSNELIQPDFKPIKINRSEFSVVAPRSITDEYVGEKVRANILRPARAFSCEPNIKAGASAKSPVKGLDQEPKIVINAKFAEYDRLRNEQSGQYKHKKILESLELRRPEAPKNSQMSRMKRTLFQKFMPDKYHLYNKPVSIRKSSLIQSDSILRRSRSIASSQMRPTAVETRPQNATALNKGQSRVHNTIEVSSSRLSPIIERRQLMTLQRPKLKSLVTQKNIDSC